MLKDEGQLIPEAADHETALRIKFPSFLASVKYHTVIDERGYLHCFEPHKPTVNQVQEVVEDCQARAGPDAVATCVEPRSVFCSAVRHCSSLEPFFRSRRS